LNKFQKDGGGSNSDTRQCQASKSKCAHFIILDFQLSNIFSARSPRTAYKNMCSIRERESVCFYIDEGPSEHPDGSIEMRNFGRFEI
jgi:hypothetical protein